MKNKRRAGWMRIQVASAPSLQHRIYGFAACSIAGLALMLLETPLTLQADCKTLCTVLHLDSEYELSDFF
ncbi:hypothetical protein L195_g040793 [Trifolium pratense]|uniref:Uncharacterized protein n=1 Tax=Trifolium pratense TaxID=57577 RepID=A0A2K3M1T6_TRIPR|nr:hypothetical protein L195_g040793 [Trifolium pratense]